MKLINANLQTWHSCDQKAANESRAGPHSNSNRTIRNFSNQRIPQLRQPTSAVYQLFPVHRCSMIVFSLRYDLIDKSCRVAFSFSYFHFFRNMRTKMIYLFKCSDHFRLVYVPIRHSERTF